MAGTDLTNRATTVEARRHVADIAQGFAVLGVGLQQVQAGMDGLLALLNEAAKEQA